MKRPAPQAESDESQESLPRSSAGGRLLLLLGSIGPLGHLPASGTVAVAVAGVPLYYLMFRYLTWTQYAVVTVIFTLASMGLHQLGDKLLGESDSRKLVWDELTGYFFAMFLLPWSWKLAVTGFFIERLLDIVKVPPANLIDNRMHNGIGVVLDDVVAGIYTCAILHALTHFMPFMAG